MCTGATTSVLGRTEIVLHVPTVNATSAGIGRLVINTYTLIGTARRPVPSGHLIRFIYLFYTHMYISWYLYYFCLGVSYLLSKPSGVVFNWPWAARNRLEGMLKCFPLNMSSGPEEESPQRTCGLMCTLEYKYHVLKKPVSPYLLRSSASECEPYLDVCLPLNPRLS